MQKNKNRPILGFMYSMLTVLAWGTIPIAIKEVVSTLSSSTLIFSRFLIASIGVYIILKISHRSLHQRAINPLIFRKRFIPVLLIGTLGLSLNFIFFTNSVRFVEAEVAQILSQISPYLMMFLSVIVLKERIYLYQKIGAIIMFIGMLLFFNQKFATFNIISENYKLGFLFAFLAPIVWAFYGIAQKVLLRHFSSQEILCVFYTGCAIIFLPVAKMYEVTDLSILGWIMLIYCCANTIFGYGAYAEALNNWDIAKVSAVVTLTPLMTILCSFIISYYFPEHFVRMNLNLLGFIGALIVVIGVICTAIGHKIMPTLNR